MSYHFWYEVRQAFSGTKGVEGSQYDDGEVVFPVKSLGPHVSDGLGDGLGAVWPNEMLFVHECVLGGSVNFAAADVDEPAEVMVEAGLENVKAS